MVFVAALLFCAGVGMWLCLLAVRAAKVTLGRRRRRRRAAILAAITRFRIDRDAPRLAGELRQADPAALIELASRLLPLLTSAEREAFETALARRRLAEFMTRGMRQANEGRRLLYCELLGALGGERSIETLWTAIGDRSPAVRIAAAISLAARREVSDIGALLARLGGEARRSARLTYLFDHLVRDRAAEIRGIAGDGAIEPRVRICAYLALIGVDEADYLELVPQMAADPAPEVAAAAVRQLLERPHPQAGPLIAGLLASDSMRVRREASECAAWLGDSGLAPALRIALRDRDPLVHAAAARSLFELAESVESVGAPHPRIDGPVVGAALR